MLAHELRMSIGQLRASMSPKEYRRWGLYLARRAQREEAAWKGIS